MSRVDNVSTKSWELQNVGRKYKDGRYERALNRALFEVQAYYLSFPAIRGAARNKKRTVRDHSKELFADTAFAASIEATTKSIENYKLRFSRYQRMLQKALDVEVSPLRLSASK